MTLAETPHGSLQQQGDRVSEPTGRDDLEQLTQIVVSLFGEQDTERLETDAKADPKRVSVQLDPTHPVTITLQQVLENEFGMAAVAGDADRAGEARIRYRSLPIPGQRNESMPREPTELLPSSVLQDATLVVEPGTGAVFIFNVMHRGAYFTLVRTQTLGIAVGEAGNIVLNGGLRCERVATVGSVALDKPPSAVELYKLAGSANANPYEVERFCDLAKLIIAKARRKQ